jgi:hypothetical protein
MRIAIRALGNRQSSIPRKIEQGRGALKAKLDKIQRAGRDLARRNASLT